MRVFVKKTKKLYPPHFFKVKRQGLRPHHREMKKNLDVIKQKNIPKNLLLHLDLLFLSRISFGTLESIISIVILILFSRFSWKYSFFIWFVSILFLWDFKGKKGVKNNYRWESVLQLNRTIPSIGAFSLFL